MTFEVARFIAAGLGVVLASAGLAKLVSSQSVAPYLTELGVPERLARPLAAPVPFLEMTLGAALVTGIAMWLAALAAVALCAAFLIVQLTGAVQDRSTPCRCFGALDTGQSRVLPVVRAGLLLAAALAVGSEALSGSQLLQATPPEASLEQAALGATAGAATLLAVALLSEVGDFERWRPRPGDPAVADLRYR